MRFLIAPATPRRFAFLVAISLVVLLAAVACTGRTGETGPEGPSGATGGAGAAGPAGPEGLAGPEGDPGARGFPGFVGPRGPEGRPGQAEPDFADFVTDIRRAVVFIRLTGSQASGVRISPTEILTAQHVVGNIDRVQVSIEGGVLQPATVTGYDFARDIALLTLDAPVDGLIVEIPKVNLVLEDLSGRQVEEMGYEVALVAFVPDISQTTPIATFGRIGALWNPVPNGFAYGQVDAAATNGMSGGPVFNKYAEFLGILVTSSSFDGNVRYLRFSEINNVLEDLRNGSRR